MIIQVQGSKFVESITLQLKDATTLSFKFIDVIFDDADQFVFKANDIQNRLYSFTDAGCLRFKNIDYGTLKNGENQVAIQISRNGELICSDTISIIAEIQGGGIEYTAGNGIKIEDNQINVSNSLTILRDSNQNSTTQAYVNRLCGQGSYFLSHQGLLMTGNSGYQTGSIASPSTYLSGLKNAIGIYTNQSKSSANGILSLSLGESGCYLRSDFLKFKPRTYTLNGKSGYVFLTPKLVDKGVVTDSYLLNGESGNIHKITTTDNIDCIVTVNAPLSYADDQTVNNGFCFRLIVDNTAGVDVVFKQQIIISDAQPYLCYVDFQYINKTIGYKVVSRYNMDLMRNIND